MRLFIIILFLVLFGISAKANDLQITVNNIEEVNRFEGTFIVDFSISWQNSWRVGDIIESDSIDTSNWDAVWVVFKYSVNQRPWLHAYIDDATHISGNGTSLKIEEGKIDENEPYNSSSNPYVGTFIYRSEIGSGEFKTENIKIKLKVEDPNTLFGQTLKVNAIGLEMVYVPEIRFISDLVNVNNVPTVIDSTVKSISANYSFDNELFKISDLGEYPNGYKAFYVMKNELSNSIFEVYNDMIANTEITLSDPFSSANISFINYSNLLQWFGLRPMTLFEYEKAVRGSNYPFPNEYAWGTDGLSNNRYIVSNSGTSNEVTNATIDEYNGNAYFNTTKSTAEVNSLRPGIFATTNSTRISSGSSFWGVKDISGNMSEPVLIFKNIPVSNYNIMHGNGGRGLYNLNNKTLSASDIYFFGGSYHDSPANFLKPLYNFQYGQNPYYNSTISSYSQYQRHGFRALRTAPALN